MTAKIMKYEKVTGFTVSPSLLKSETANYF